MTRTVFDDLLIDDVPMERVCFTASNQSVSFELDTEDDDKVLVEFRGVACLRYGPQFDRRQLAADGEYKKTVLEVEGSVWIVELSELHRRFEEVPPTKLRHFVIPSDGGVWEVLAAGVVVQRPLT